MDQGLNSALARLREGVHTQRWSLVWDTLEGVHDPVAWAYAHAHMGAPWCWGRRLLAAACDAHHDWLNSEDSGRRARFSGADLRGAQLEAVNLYRADLRAVDLRDARLRDANLSWSDLTGARLDRCDLTHAYIEAACLEGVTLHNATIDRAYGWILRAGQRTTLAEAAREG